MRRSSGITGRLPLLSSGWTSSLALTAQASPTEHPIVVTSGPTVRSSYPCPAVPARTPISSSTHTLIYLHQPTTSSAPTSQPCSSPSLPSDEPSPSPHPPRPGSSRSPDRSRSSRLPRTRRPSLRLSVSSHLVAQPLSVPWPCTRVAEGRHGEGRAPLELHHAVGRAELITRAVPSPSLLHLHPPCTSPEQPMRPTLPPRARPSFSSPRRRRLRTRLSTPVCLHPSVPLRSSARRSES